MHEGNICERKKLRGLAKIAIDQLFDTQVIMPLTFRHILLQPLKASRLKGLELILHSFHVGGERQLTAIIKYKMVGWIHTLQIKFFLHRCTQGMKLSFIQQGHDQQRGACVKLMTLSTDAIATPSC